MDLIQTQIRICKNRPEQVPLIITLSVIFSEKSSTPNAEESDRWKRHVNWSAHGVRIAPDWLSTPTLSKVPHCPFSSSDTPRLSATWLFFIYNFLVFHSVLLTSKQIPGPPYRPAGIYCSPTCGYDGNQLLTCWYKTSAGRVIYERQAGGWCFWQGCLCGSHLKGVFVDSSSWEERWPWIVRNLD